MSQNLKPTYPFTEDRLSSLRTLQELLVRLYFSDQLQQEVAQDPELALRNCKLDSSYKKYLPAPFEPDFQAECWGRRIMVAREIASRFTRFYSHLFGNSKNPVSIAESAHFRNFLGSDEFLRCNSSLEHPYGIGRGYENVSKFFLWLIGPGREMLPTDAALWNSAYTDFSIHLLNTSKHSSVEFYRQMKTAVMFADHADSEMMIIVTANRILRSRLDSTASQSIFDLSKIGA